MLAVDALDPLIAGALLERRAKGFESSGQLARENPRPFGRVDQRVKERRGGQVGDRKAVTGEVLAT